MTRRVWFGGVIRPFQLDEGHKGAGRKEATESETINSSEHDKSFTSCI